MTNETRDTAERLRSDIDSGRTGDKIPASDPAAAPLGTDEEAAGTPVSAGTVAHARRSEQSGPSAPTERRGPGYAWILFVVALVFAVVFVVAGLSLR